MREFLIMKNDKDLSVNELNIEYKNLSELTPYTNNSRTHSDDQISQITASIKEFGFTNPILIDEKGVVIAGHGRIEGATRAGLREVPTITLSGLTEAKKKAYVIADNQLALNAGWDIEKLILEIQDLEDLDFNIDLLGFDDSFLNSLFPDDELSEDSENLKEEFSSVLEVVVTCDSESEQESVYNKLSKEGYKCRILSM